MDASTDDTGGPARRPAEAAADELTAPVKTPAKRVRKAPAKKAPATTTAGAVTRRAPRKTTAAAASAPPRARVDSAATPAPAASGTTPEPDPEVPSEPTSEPAGGAGGLAVPARGEVATPATGAEVSTARDTALDTTRDTAPAERRAPGQLDGDTDGDAAPPPPPASGDAAAGPARPRGSGLLARAAVVVLLVVLGAVAGTVAAGRATPSWTADSQVLVRERDYAAIILGQSVVVASNTPQRSLAAQVLAAQSPTFTDEIARQAAVDPAAVADGLVVTASPDANVIVFTMTSADPAEAAAVADVAADLEVSTYRDQLVQGLGSIAAGNTLDATQLAQLAQVQAFERISPSAQVIATAGEATGGPTSAARGALTGGVAGAVVAFLLLAADAAWRSRGRRRS